MTDVLLDLLIWSPFLLLAWVAASIYSWNLTHGARHRTRGDAPLNWRVVLGPNVYRRWLRDRRAAR